MANLPFCGAPEYASTPGDPAAAVNAPLVGLDAAMDSIAVLAIAAGANALPVATLQGAGVLQVTGALTGDATVTISAALTKKFLFQNGTSGAYKITLKVTGETGVTLPATTQGKQIPLWANGTDIVPVTDPNAQPVGSLGGLPAVLQAFFPGVPGASVPVALWVAAAPFAQPASLTGSQMAAATAATSTTTFGITKNGGSIGSVSIASGGFVTWTFASAVSFAAGDVLAILAPVSPDLTLGNLAFGLLGSYS